ncbi:MAG: NUDIX hydrolase [Deltaproteobacteria bacterium]|nr:NUDIX hydrolase [Deltaproteobacteria bacterium]
MADRATYHYCPRCGTALAPRHDGERERLACPGDGCGFLHYDNPTPVVAALVEHEGEVLLVRNQGWPESWLGLVSGFLERGEGPEEGVLREVAEELGLTGEIVSLIGVYGFESRNEVIVAYHVRAAGTVSPSHEIAAVKRVPPGRLKPWAFGTGRAVADWLARRADGSAP